MPIQCDSAHYLQPVPHLYGAFKSGCFQGSGYFIYQSGHDDAKITRFFMHVVVIRKPLMSNVLYGLARMARTSSCYA